MDTMHASEETVALNASLARLCDAHARRWARGLPETATLLELRDAAHALSGEIQAVCNSGRTVIAHMPRASHRRHEIRKVGVLFNEVVLGYATSTAAPDCAFSCVLTEAEQFEIVEQG